MDLDPSPNESSKSELDDGTVKTGFPEAIPLGWQRVMVGPHVTGVALV